MKKAFTIIRVSGEDQLKGYGPDSQWTDDVVPNAPLLGLEVGENFKRVIQESATSWDREKFEGAVREALDVYRKGSAQALVFPRVDRETRFIFGSFPLLCEVIRSGMEVYFARERFQLDPNNDESVSRYLRKAEEARAYVETMRINTIRGRRRRAERDHMMPTAKSKWAHDYHPYRRDWGKMPDATSGRYTVNPERAVFVRQWADWILVDGFSTNKCCKLMAEKYDIKICRSTIVDVISDPAMIGKFYAYRSKDVRSPEGRRKIVTDERDWLLVYDDPKAAILTEEQFHALKKRLQQNRENSPRHTIHWYPPLRGIVFHSCGRRMTGTYSGNQPIYRCAICRANVKARPLWEQIQAGIKERLLDSERLVPAIKAQLESGVSIDRLEEDLKLINQRKEMLDQAAEKAVRLHLYLTKYPPEKLQAEIDRVEEQRQQVDREKAEKEKQLAELTQAIMDKDGLKRFCQLASRNMENLDDGQWRVLLEMMHLQVLVYNSGVTVKVAVPTIKDEKAAIVTCTSGYSINVTNL